MVNIKRCRFCEDLSIDHLVSLAKKEHDGYLFFPREAFYQHQPSIDDLESSATNGCDLCSLILGCLLVTPAEFTKGVALPESMVGQDCNPDESMYAEAKELETCSIKVAISSDHFYGEHQGPLPADYQLDTLLIQVGPRTDDDDGYGEHWELLPLLLTLSVPVGSKEMFVNGCRIGRSELDPDLSSPQNFDIARNWLQTCRQEHKNCPSECAQVLPTRVVDVGLEPNFQDLHIVYSHGKMGHYIALSHCWGGRITPLLTTETIESFTIALPYQDLPANFRDAITITRELGVRYLWIDSLCIIQDSKHDWEVESMKMADVYRHAVLTISALSSPGSTHGILTKDSQLSPPTDHVKLFDHTTSRKLNVSRKNARSEYLTGLAVNCPLHKRGWCLQEMILSPRQLLYGEQQIYWKCPHGFRDATGAGPSLGRRFPSHQVFETLTSVLYADILRPSTRLGMEHDINTVLDEYYKLVQEYSDRQLSFGSDKLPALAGIVQRLHPIIGGDYLAGLWSKDIHRGLSWRAENTLTRHATPSRAPSWSWAVTDDNLWTDVPTERVKTAGPDNPLSLKLISHNLSLENPYGAVASGTLVVNGLTRRMRLSNQTVDANNSKSNLGPVYFDEHDLGASASYALFPTTVDELLVLNTTRDTNEDWELEEEDIRPERYLVLPVHAEVKVDGEWIEDVAACLVLQQKSSDGDEAYERIGVVRMYSVKISWLSGWELRTIHLV